MSAGKYDIDDIEQGCDWSLRVQLKDSASPPVAIDITDYNLFGQIRKSYSDPTVIAAMSFLKDVQTLVDPTGQTGKGWFTAKLTKLQTGVIVFPKASNNIRKPLVFIYDIVSVNGSGEEDRELEGTATVSPQVTQVP